MDVIARERDRLIGIGQAARLAGCSPSLLRYYEGSGLLPQPARVEGQDRRVYGPADVEVIVSKLASLRNRAGKRAG